MVKAVMTGKLQFKDLANSIIADLIRIQIRRSITEPLSNLLSGTSNEDSGSGFIGKFIDYFSKHADGGYIPTVRGSSRSDSQLIAVSGSEYVVNARSTAKYLPILEAINRGAFKGFNKGGHTGNVSPVGQPSTVKVMVNVADKTGGSVKISALQPIQTQQDAFDINMVVDMVDKGIARKGAHHESSVQKQIEQMTRQPMNGDAW